MLKKIFDFLTKDITGKTWTEEQVHPILGRMTLFAQRDNNRSYWECAIESEDQEIFVGVESPDRSIPSREQVQFVQTILANPDAAFGKASALLIPEFETWCKQKFPEDWQDAFKLTGVMVPAQANEMNPWELSFDSTNGPESRQFTCHFENGRPSRVTIDG